ncbi:GGDEF domain-containing protein [Pelomonas sp. V22]|uniref:GGDEF domain-containing protein n=1 Tax=Pelomonas sp. V22 TaxID=2822139 RepID=UPI0024A91E80|nr:GGDEF domain-containing protein [Pelomonas sp. V22]MDI4635562.1 GGDEF domain-containing protein [Pelomonas sp. V22]
MLDAMPLTLLATNVLFLLVSALVWAALSQVLHASHRPALLLALANALLAASLGGNAMRGLAWDWLAYWGANLMAIAAFALMRQAVPAMMGERTPWWPTALLLALCAVLLAAVPFGSSWLPIINFGAMGLLTLVCAVDAWRRLRRHARAGLALALASPLFLVAALLLLRLALLLSGHNTHLRDADDGNLAWLWAVLLMSLVLNATLAFLVLMRLILRIRRLTERDALTDALNRRAFGELLAAEHGQLGRGRSHALVVLDIDHFKRINDSLGHAGGDAALRHLVQVLQACLREADQLGRLGGEEFGVLLPLSDLPGALCAAERMRAALQARPLEWQGQRVDMTASFGVAVAVADDIDPEALMLRADQAMYRAKAAGRNRVEF